MPWLSRAGGLVLLVSLFLPWYAADIAIVRNEEGTHTLTSGLYVMAWASMTGVAIALALASTLIVLAPRVRVVATLAALVLVAHALLDQPEEGLTLLRFGAWVGLAGVLLAAVPIVLERRPWAETAAGTGGLALLILLSAQWYWEPHPEFLENFDLGWSAWDRLAIVDLALAALAVLALAVPLSGSEKLAAVARAVGWVAVVLVVFRLLVTPGEATLAWGAYLALLAAILAWAPLVRRRAVVAA
jgi:hypothetical protein